MEKYGDQKALIASIITRWGSQYSMLFSLKQSQKAIIEWTTTTKAESSPAIEIIGSIHSLPFWWQLSELLNILKRLHPALKESEAQNSTVMEVTQRWLYLEAEFRTQSRFAQFKDEFLSYFAVMNGETECSVMSLASIWLLSILVPHGTLLP